MNRFLGIVVTVQQNVRHKELKAVHNSQWGGHRPLARLVEPIWWAMPTLLK